MRNKLAVLALLLVVGGLILHENLTKRPTALTLTTAGQVEMCLSCHKDEKLDPAHDAKMLGCAACHLGDPLAIGKKAAHKGMVMNPGDLRVVEKTCGVEGCHGADVAKVKNSLMATNRGILATLLYYWGEAPHQDGNFSVEKLIESGETSTTIASSAPPAISGNLKATCPAFSAKRAAAVRPAIISRARPHQAAIPRRPIR